MSKLKDYFGQGWYELMQDYLEGPAFYSLGSFIEQRRKAFDVKVFPKKEQVFRAFQLCPLEKVKVVILGMDPYPTEGNANGLAFAYTGNGPIPASLKNIHKELESDLDTLLVNFDYDLEHWAKQGVLLLNTALTVEQGKPGTHTKQWKEFTETLLNRLVEEKVALVYILWGNHAKKFAPIIHKYNTNFIIHSAHPSPLSCRKGFFGSKPFSRTNNILKEVAKANEEDESKYLIEWKQQKTTN